MADNKYRKEEIYVSLLTHLFIKKDNKAFKKYLEIAESLNLKSPGIMYIKGGVFKRTIIWQHILSFLKWIKEVFT